MNSSVGLRICSDYTTANPFTIDTYNNVSMGALSATTGTFSSTVTASQFNGSGAGLTASLSIGGNAATATLATTVQSNNSTWSTPGGANGTLGSGGGGYHTTGAVSYAGGAGGTGYVRIHF